MLWCMRKGIQGTKPPTSKVYTRNDLLSSVLFCRLLSNVLFGENINFLNFFKSINYLEMWNVVIKVQFINTRLIWEYV